MRELLDSSTKRRLEILEQLNDTPNWISSNELATTNNASLRTINSDVHYLKENWSPHLIIETSKKNGVRLSTPQSSHVHVVYNAVMENSEAFQLLEKIFFNPNTNIEDWEEEMFISESSLYRISNQLDASLNNFGLSLNKRPCQVTNKNEIYARYFYTTYFNEVYGIHDWPFLTDRKETVELAAGIYKKAGYVVDEVQIMYLAILLAVSFQRMEQDFYTSVHHKENIKEEHRQYFWDVEAKFNRIMEPLHLKLTEKIIDDLINSIYFLKAYWIDVIDLEDIHQEFSHFTKKVQKTLDLELDNQSYDNIKNILMFIYLQQRSYPFPDYILFNQFDFNGSAIRTNFPTFTKVMENNLLEMEQRMDFPWHSQFKNEVLYWVMVKWKRLPNILESKKEKAKLLVFSDLGEEHATLLAEMIDKNFGSKVALTVYSGSVIFLEDAKKEDFIGYDYFVTTFLKEVIPEDKLIVVDAIPSDQDWGKIRRAINRIHTIHSELD